MRDLLQQEQNQVSAGLACFDADFVHQAYDKAYQDSMIFTALTVPLLMAAALGASGSVMMTAAAGVVAMPYVAAYGFFHSSNLQTLFYT